jgi:hypothetical protein
MLHEDISLHVWLLLLKVTSIECCDVDDDDDDSDDDDNDDGGD